MKRKTLFVVTLTIVLTMLMAVVANAAGQSDLAAIRAATAQYHRAEVAEAAGYERPGIEECVALPGVGGMGYHFVNWGLVDFDLDALQPEALVYAPGPDGQMKLVAVEYIVPAEPWDAVYDDPPTILGQDLHYNPFLGIYALHAWVWQQNPLGIFSDWNPKVSC
jgi:hypothetical protein